jgi:hypothetical protein
MWVEWCSRRVAKGTVGTVVILLMRACTFRRDRSPRRKENLTMKWTTTGSDHVSGQYRIHAEDDKWHVDTPVNGGMFAELSQAKTWCSEHEVKRSLDEHVAKIVAEAPPFSAEQARDIARIFNIEGRRAQKRAERQPHPASAPPPPGLTKRKLLGTPERSNEEVLASVRKEWEEGLAKSPMYSLYYTSPEDMFRWRVQFDCGCIEDWCNTSDDPQSLLEATRHNPFDFLDGKKNLLPGEYLCKGKHPRPDLSLREVASWDERLGEKVIPADPADPPEWWVEAMAKRAERQAARGDEFDDEPDGEVGGRSAGRAQDGRRVGGDVDVWPWHEGDEGSGLDTRPGRHTVTGDGSRHPCAARQAGRRAERVDRQDARLWVARRRARHGLQPMPHRAQAGGL